VEDKHQEMTDYLKRVLAICVMKLCLLALLTVCHPTKQAPIQSSVSVSDVESYLQDGDIICRLGDRMWSTYVKDMSLYDKRFSHVGIVHIVDGVITVVNADTNNADGKDCVIEDSLAEFLTVARAIGVYRLSDVTEKSMSSVVMKYLGYPFDWDFDLHDDSKIYCTELLYLVMKETTPDVQLQLVYVKELKKDIIPLEAVSHSEYFQEIVYLRK